MAKMAEIRRINTYSSLLLIRQRILPVRAIFRGDLEEQGVLE
jgi:hypothetical protein